MLDVVIASSSRFCLFAQPARAVAAVSVRNLYSSSTLMPCSMYKYICLFFANWHQVDKPLQQQVELL